jgi:putative ABC transport system permease protein
VSSILLRPFALRDPERLVLIWEMHRDRPEALEMTSFSNFTDVSSSLVFESTAAWQRPTSMTLKNTEGSEEIRASVVTASYFRVLGTDPTLGRTFGADEGRGGQARIVVLSHGFWQQRFGGSAEALDSTLTLDGAPHTVIGVASRDFESPAGDTDVFVPMDFTPNAIDRGQSYLTAIGRLKPGVSLEQAQAKMERVGAALAREFPATNEGVAPRLVGFSDHVLGPVRPVLLSLFGGVLFLLVVACANVSNLQLARIVSRERDIAIRLSLGASRLRVFGSTLVESLWIWSGGAAAGLLVIVFGFPFLSSLLQNRLPRALEGSADSGTLLFTAVVAAGTALAFGIPTALYACRAPLERALRPSRAPLTEDPASRAMRRVLVAAQVALACVLLIGGGLLMKSLLRLSQVSLGFDAGNVVVARLALGDAYAEEGRRVRYIEDLLARLRTTPSVFSAGASTVSPMNSFGIDFDVPYHRPEDPEPERAAAPKARFRSVTPGYFRTLATPIVYGRDFAATDRADTPRVVIVNRTLGRRLGGEESVIGTSLRFFWSDWQTYEIVGVVEDTRAYRAAEAPQPELFVPYPQNPYLVMNVVVRSTTRPGLFVETVRSAVSSLDPDEPAIGVFPLEDLVSRTTARENLAARLLLALSVGAILLSLAGVHAVLSFTARRRIREIGIRMALGAAPRGILRWALRQGAVLTLCGIAPGLLVSSFATRFLADLLFSVSARDPLVFTLAPVLVFVLSMGASYAAVRPAIRVDPAAAFRAD